MTRRVGTFWFGPQLLEEIKDATPDALFEGAQQLLEAALVKVPRRSGRLAHSGYAASASKSTYTRIGRGYRREIKPGPKEALVAFSAPHAHLLEFGTVKMSAKPFLRPAYDEQKEKILDTVIAAMKSEVDL